MTSQTRAAPRLVRWLDLGILALALPVFLAGGLPLVGYAAAAVAWLLQRTIQSLALRHAIESGDRRAALGALAGSLLVRLSFMVVAVLLAGLAERDAGVAAGLLAVVLFTIHLSTSLIVNPLGEARR